MPAARCATFLVPTVALGLALAARPGHAGSAPITPSPLWKSAIAFPDDPFVAAGSVFGEPGWVKFTILVDDPTVVYFQDSNAIPFHWNFAAQALDPWLGISLDVFESIALHASGQELILGAVLYQPAFGLVPAHEYGIQFIRNDPYTAQEVVDLFQLVASAIDAPGGSESFYFPAFHQLDVAEESEAFLAANGVTVSTPARWSSGNDAYANGWALGRLRFVPGDEIEDAFLAGTITTSDILFTDGVPSELPPLAGIVTLAPATPNSHVAILAQTFNVPFVYLGLDEDVARAQMLVDRLVVLRARPLFGVPEIRLIDVEDELDQPTIDALLALKAPPPLDLAPKEHFGAISRPVDGLALSDVRFVGGKAANYAILRSAIPDSAPIAAALTFDLWDAYLDQTLASGLTLRKTIHDRLDGYVWPPLDAALLDDDLDDVRDLFTDEDVTSFGPALEGAIIAALQDPRYGFDPSKNIRFRSSTNVEDVAQFTGAGLYESKSGCLLDDLDGDEEGPSICDPTEEDERGVFRAIRRVFASFYNFNAFLARLEHGVNENEVGMAVLVHHSFPDPFEMANGVALLVREPNGETSATLVSQAGAVPVTNPESGALPEEVFISGAQTVGQPILAASSNLVQLGATVLAWPDDYTELYALLIAVADEFEAVTGRESFVLDFEYKKIAPAGSLEVKQVREVPQPDETPSITPFLVNDPTDYCTRGGLFPGHRQKMLFSAETRSMWLTPENLAGGLFGEITMRFTDGCEVHTFTGSFDDLPGTAHAWDGSEGVATTTWSLPDLVNPRTYEFRVGDVPTLVAPSESPILTMSDFGDPIGLKQPIPFPMNLPRRIDVTVTHGEPVFWGSPPNGTVDMIQLTPCAPAVDVPPDSPPARIFEGPLGETVTIDFGLSLDGTPTSLATTIEGLTSEPIVLTSGFTQTYQPGHHYFTETFLIEPRLQPGIAPEQIAELDAQSIRMIEIFAWTISTEMSFTYHDDDVLGPCGPLPLTGDVNGDGLVGFADLTMLLISWGECAPPLPPPADSCPADSSGDGAVGFADLVTLLLSWTP